MTTKTKIVSSDDLNPEKSLLASDYIDAVETTDDIPEEAWSAIDTIASMCFRTARDKGWWSKYITPEGNFREVAFNFLPEIIGSKFMLQVSEISEALEEVRKKKKLTEVYYSGTLENEDGSELVFCGTFEEVTDWLDDQVGKTKGPKPEGVPIELADAAIRIFDFAKLFEIDLVAAIKLKMRYNEGRPFMHGGKAI